MKEKIQKTLSSSRRTFLKGSAAAVICSTVTGNTSLADVPRNHRSSMLGLWEAMGRAMLDREFLDLALGPGHVDKIVRNSESLHNLFMGKKFRLSRFEIGELFYWFDDKVFVEMLRDLQNEWETRKRPEITNDREFYAAVALALFDKPFRQCLFGKDGGALAQQFNFDLTVEEISAISSFLTDRQVQKTFRILEGLGWSSACFEGLSFDKGYKHVHPMYDRA